MPFPNQPPNPTPAPVQSQSTPGTQPRAGRPMPQRPTLQAPPSGPQHVFRSEHNTLAQSKTKKGKHVVKQPQYSTRAKPQTEY